MVNQFNFWLTLFWTASPGFYQPLPLPWERSHGYRYNIPLNTTVKLSFY